MDKHRYGPWAVVTGASAGIGEALARELAANGIHLVLVARREDRLRALAASLGVQTRILALDLGDPEAVLEVERATRDLDVGLVAHAAGFGLGGAFVDGSLQRHVELLDVNVRGSLILAHAFAPRLVGRGRGGLVLFGSILGFTGAPFQADYAASKAWVLAFGEGLQVELAPRGVDVLVLAPGPTNTEFGDVAGLSMGSGASPAQVARAAVRRLGRKGIVFPDLSALFIRSGFVLLPRILAVRLWARIMSGMVRAHGA